MQTITLRLRPSEAADSDFIRKKALSKLRLKANANNKVKVVRRSIDARGYRPVVQLQINIYENDSWSPEPAILNNFHPLKDTAKSAIIVGAGPAGYFAALQLIENGIKPIVFDRGKDVRSRRRDLRAIQQFGEVHPHSNYCFGEGGAGTYSDGKLYTRSQKRGNIIKPLKLLVEHGAQSDILIDAHPHIGSNKLPKVVANIRETILNYGGEIHFNSLVTDLIIQEDKILGVIVNQSKEYLANAVVLATGHSARDIFRLLHQKNIYIEAKPFALGVRIEHPQPLIDQIQYNQSPREEHLPASSYQLTCQVEHRGVYSFCMCPGGLVVPAATTPGEIVINGMSMSRRDSPYANSGTVTAVELEDLEKRYNNHGVFASMEFQRDVEQAVFNFGDGSQKAPGQRLTDFVIGKVSSELPGGSYIPGLYSAPLHEILPDFIYNRLREGVKIFGKKMKGYFTAEANVIATESRTSSPIRIPRNRETFMHEDVLGLFPCGEGAGYAGGIISAAVDGQNVAKAVTRFLT